MHLSCRGRMKARAQREKKYLINEDDDDDAQKRQLGTLVGQLRQSMRACNHTFCALQLPSFTIDVDCGFDRIRNEHTLRV